MKIISGKLRGKVLKVPSCARPTLSRVREDIFNIILGNFPLNLKNANVLDAFAGSGALGLEALSRGAQHVTFVDQNAEAGATLAQNIQNIALRNQCSIFNTTIQNALENMQSPFALVFIDPPYNNPLHAQVLETLARRNLLTEGALIVSESNNPHIDLPEGFSHFRAKSYGKKYIEFITYHKPA